MTAVGAPHIPFPLVERAIRTGDLPYLRRHARQITLSLPNRISVCVLVAEQEPGSLERDALDFIEQWTTEVPARKLDDYRVILGAIDAMRFAPQQSAAELVALCCARGVYP